MTFFQTIPPAAKTSAPLRARLAALLGERMAASVAGLFLLVVALACIAPQLLTHADPLVGDAAASFLPPSAEHWLGTDQIGRDIFARIIHGARLTLLAALAATSIGVASGALIGTIAALSGGIVDALICRLVDTLLTLPGLLLALFLVAVLGSGLATVAIAVGSGSVALFARFARARVLQIRTERFVQSAREFGTSPLQSLYRHVLPNVAGPVTALALIEFAHVVLSISILGFLGYGVEPPNPEWGVMIADGRAYVNRSWGPTLFPGLALILTVVSLSLLYTAWTQPRSQHRDGGKNV